MAEAELNAASLDLGTMFLQSARDSKDGKSVVYTEERNCYREIPFDEEFEAQLKAQNCHYMKEGQNLYVLGSQAFIQAGMAEVGADLKGTGNILKRPMKDGILNPESPKIALSVLRELMKGAIEKGIGPARNGEILYFSIPANPVDSTLNNSFHAKMAERYLCGLGYDARPINEALAVVFAENPKMHMPSGENVPFTGVGISMGAGMVNFCLAERGVQLDAFSVARSGDWIDSQVSRMTGQPTTKVMRVKEKKLNFDKIDENDDIILALECYYDDLVNYVFEIFAKRFSGNKGSIDHPIDVILAGGTSNPPGFDKRVKKLLTKMDLPFEIGEIKSAGGGDTTRLLQTVARGCYIRAKQAAKKKNNAQDALNDLE